MGAGFRGPARQAPGAAIYCGPQGRVIDGWSPTRDVSVPCATRCHHHARVPARWHLSNLQSPRLCSGSGRPRGVTMMSHGEEGEINSREAVNGAHWAGMLGTHACRSLQPLVSETSVTSWEFHEHRGPGHPPLNSPVWRASWVTATVLSTIGALILPIPWGDTVYTMSFPHFTRRKPGHPQIGSQAAQSPQNHPILAPEADGRLLFIVAYFK